MKWTRDHHVEYRHHHAETLRALRMLVVKFGSNPQETQDRDEEQIFLPCQHPTLGAQMNLISNRHRPFPSFFLLASAMYMNNTFCNTRFPRIFIDDIVQPRPFPLLNQEVFVVQQLITRRGRIDNNHRFELLQRLCRAKCKG